MILHRVHDSKSFLVLSKTLMKFVRFSINPSGSLAVHSRSNCQPQHLSRFDLHICQSLPNQQYKIGQKDSYIPNTSSFLFPSINSTVSIVLLECIFPCRLYIHPFKMYSNRLKSNSLIRCSFGTL